MTNRFNNPAIRSRLEMLMGSNVVRITDRKYMMKLQERIKEDHLENLKRRIHEREADEVEREKKLILSGKISLDEAPKELKNHPICRINELAKKILEEKRAKMKIVTRTDLYKTSIKRIKEAERAETESDMEMEEEESETDESASAVCIPDAEVGEDINKGFMFSKEEYDRLRYEAPLVKVLKEIDGMFSYRRFVGLVEANVSSVGPSVIRLPPKMPGAVSLAKRLEKSKATRGVMSETKKITFRDSVDEMYKLADQIVGPFKPGK